MFWDEYHSTSEMLLKKEITMKGWKTWVATIGYGVIEAVKAFFPEYESMLTLFQQTVLVPMGVIGVAHKIEKLKVQ